MSNYMAVVASIEKTEPIDGADRIHTAYVLGEQVVVSKDWGVGKVGLYFMADTQLSDDFCRENNLYRESSKNSNIEKTGFFDDNRRVRCQPFLKVRSEGFFCELDTLSYINSTIIDALNEGDCFDCFDGVKLCEKFISPKVKKRIDHENRIRKRKGLSEMSAPLFEKHCKTLYMNQNLHKIDKGDVVSFHAKVHGTSARMAYTKVVRKPNTIIQHIKNLFGFFKRERMEYVVGSRNVVLFEDIFIDSQYGTNKFRFDVMEMVKPHLKPNMVVYGEIAGYSNGKPIMPTANVKALKNKEYIKKYGNTIVYNYNCNESQFRFHVYRITNVSELTGEVYEWSSSEVDEWCMNVGLLSPYQVHDSMVYDGDKDKLKSLVDYLTERPDVLTEDYIDPSHISEGIIVRVDKADGSSPIFFKSKSYAFKVMEGITKDSGVIDTEEIS